MAGTDALPVSSNDIEFPSLPVGTWDEAAEELAEVQQAAGTSLPKIVVSENGNVIEQLVLDQPRLLIGRSIHNDITIGSRFVSRHHALLTRYRDATLIMDLNSTNGTFAIRMRP
jgi:pSer/pThr/pTyr-binding forkhead associated (FHA) protein